MTTSSEIVIEDNSVVMEYYQLKLEKIRQRVRLQKIQNTFLIVLSAIILKVILIYSMGLLYERFGGLV
jgi:predicted nucleic acid-binding Zn ribbon protein